MKRRINDKKNNLDSNNLSLVNVNALSILQHVNINSYIYHHPNHNTGHHWYPDLDHYHSDNHSHINIYCRDNGKLVG